MNGTTVFFAAITTGDWDDDETPNRPRRRRERGNRTNVRSRAIDYSRRHDR